MAKRAATERQPCDAVAHDRIHEQELAAETGAITVLEQSISVRSNIIEEPRR